MKITPEEIMAYVDGELDEAARNRVTIEALTDLELAARISAERALRDRLGAHYAPVIQRDIPQSWIETIHDACAPGTAEVIDLASVRGQREAIDKRRNRPARRSWTGAAIAASLLVGIFAGAQWQRLDASGPIVALDGKLLATDGLAKVLDTQLASAQDGDPVRVVGTFRRAEGDICRAFVGPQASGIACHDAGVWQMQHLMPASSRVSTPYQQAGSQNSALMALAQSMAAGDPFDAAQERESKSKGWR